jgi:hypothetical protein
MPLWQIEVRWVRHGDLSCPHSRVAGVQLGVDQEAKAPPATINNDVGELIEVQAEAEREALVDLKA